MKLLAVSIGKPERLAGKSYATGINKSSCSGAVQIGVDGLQNDAICNRKYHGGPEQAVYIEGWQSLEWWSTELGTPIHPGQFGENLVIGDLDNTSVAAGDRFQIGDVVLEATAPRMPCATFAAKMNDPQFVKRYRKAERPGFYCRVVRPGDVEAGMPVCFMPFEGSRVMMTEMMADFGKVISGETLSRYLSAPIHNRLRSALANDKVKF